MQPTHIIEGTLLSLALDNVDTDQIIPARFMYRSRREGYGDVLFRDLRDKTDIEGTLLPGLAAGNPPAGIILLAGANFGCGSSREAAVYALLDAGIKAIIAPGFGDIFRNNCYNNGLLPIVLDGAFRMRLQESAALWPPQQYTINIVRQTIAPSRTGGITLHFDIDPSLKKQMVEGLDNIDLTLRHQFDIDEFERRYAARRPWIFPAG